MSSEMNRRTFVKASAAVAAATLASSSARGANERIRLGFIGVANRGGQLINAARKLEQAEIAAICDVDQRPLDKWRKEFGDKVDVCTDFREIIARDDIDGIVIATPDHWHAIQTIATCDAGKDVYVEKPLSITIHEGRRMVEAARRNKAIVQVGTHRRSGKMYAELAKLVQDGVIGKVTVARAYRLSNMWPKGMGKAPDGEAPEFLDWDMWLGPRPVRPYRDTITPYKFRWWGAYSSQLGNWGVHYFDAIRWLLGEEAPVSIVALGGRFALDDDRDIPDTLETVYEMPSGCLIVFGQYEASGASALRRGLLELRGTKGALYVDDRGYEIVPERGGQFQDPEPRMDPVQGKTDDGDLTVQNIANFLECIKTRETPLADVEIGHRSTTFSHLGNIALASKSRIDWDAANERITNNEEANSLLHYEYREPWKLG